MDAEIKDAENDLLISLFFEAEHIRKIADHIRSDHTLTPEQLQQHLEHSFSRRYSLWSTESEVLERQ